MRATRHVCGNHLREIVQVDEYVADPGVTQEFDPVVEKRPAIDFDQTLGRRIRDRSALDRARSCRRGAVRV